MCAEPGCPTLTSTTRCPDHTAQHQRNTSRKRRAEQGTQVYDTYQWQQTRRTYRRNHPWCCHPHCGEATAHVDHVIPRRILVATQVSDPDVDQWLQPLCERHHNAKTQLVDVPLLHRLGIGEDPAELAEAALRLAEREG